MFHIAMLGFFGFIIFLVIKFVKGAVEETKYRIDKEGTEIRWQRLYENELKEDNKRMKQRMAYLKYIKNKNKDKDKGPDEETK